MNLRIVQVNTSDKGGGAERVALELHRAYLARGHRAEFLVGWKSKQVPRVEELPELPSSTALGTVLCKLQQRMASEIGHLPGVHKARAALRVAARPFTAVERATSAALGLENFCFPGSREVILSKSTTSDVVQLHNLHGDYFDLRVLPKLSHRTPVVLTLHDAWLLSGHCAHSFDCARWQSGCGRCPDLGIPPAIRRDATAYNWRRKRRIYKRSKLYIATPSSWMMRKVEQSMLTAAIIDTRVIPNGVDLSVFRPQSRPLVRQELGLPVNARVLLAIANSITANPWKDYATLRAAVEELGQQARESPLLLIALGDDRPPQSVGSAQIRFIPYQSKPELVAKYYQAADIYVHAAKADTFPNTVLEALACGTCVIATSVGGIPEQVTDGTSGFLTPVGDHQAMAAAIQRVLDDDDLRRKMEIRAVETAALRFSLEKQVNTYLDWFSEITAEERRYGGLL